MKAQIKITVSLLISIMLCLLISGCNRNNAAVSYNDTLVAYKQQVDIRFRQLNAQVDSSLKHAEYDTIQFQTNAGIVFLQNYLDSVKYVSSPANGKIFQVATTQYIESLIKTVEAYQLYSMLRQDSTSLHEIDSINGIVDEAERKIDSTSRTLLSSQADFAKFENIKLN